LAKDSASSTVGDRCQAASCERDPHEVLGEAASRWRAGGEEVELLLQAAGAAGGRISSSAVHSTTMATRG